MNLSPTPEKYFLEKRCYKYLLKIDNFATELVIYLLLMFNFKSHKLLLIPGYQVDFMVAESGFASFRE
jgi:hypothetical protein